MRTVEVLQIEDLSPSVKGLVLGCVDRRPLQYSPGQWVNVHVECARGVDCRPYSIASAPDLEHPGRFEIVVARVERCQVSSALHALRRGERIAVDGPHGSFTRAGREAEPALMIATGTGVGPLRAMIHAALRHAGCPALTLLLGCRTRGDILYREQFEALAQTHARFAFAPTLSRGDAAWRGRRGYVQTQLAEFVAEAGRPHVYLCGRLEMVNHVRTILRHSLDYDGERIHTERHAS